jgi:hypothetical protein
MFMDKFGAELLTFLTCVVRVDGVVIEAQL